MSGLKVVCGKLAVLEFNEFATVQEDKYAVKFSITDSLIGNEGNVIMAAYGKCKCGLRPSDLTKTIQVHTFNRPITYTVKHIEEIEYTLYFHFVFIILIIM